LQTQLAACLAAAEADGFAVNQGSIYLEDWPGDSLDRPLLAELRATIRGGSLASLYCYSTDRLSRSPVHLYILLEECQKAGVDLHFLTEPLDHSPEGMLVAYVRGYAAQIEREKIRERTVRGKRARATQGKLPQGTGRGAYGYRYEATTGRRRIVEGEAQVVRRIFNMVANGLSLHGIAVTLNAEMIPTLTGSRWHPLTIRRLVTNPIYMGVTYFGRTKSVPLGGRKRRLEPKEREDWLEIPNATPAVVTPDEFEAAQAALTSSPRRKEAQKPSNRYLLTAHIVCGYCGGTMAGSTLSGRYRYYYCRATRPDPRTPHKCEARYVRADHLEARVMAELAAILERPDVVLNELLQRDGGTSPLLIAQIDELESQVRAIENQEQRLVRLYRFGEVDDDFIRKESKAVRERKDRLVAELRELRERASNLNKLADLAPQVRQVCQQIRATVAQFDFEHQKLVLDAFSIKVVAYRDRTEIKGAMPSYVTIARTSA
jgi:site-specific DNA recombinase